MLRIIHTADVHLGARHDDLGEQASAQRERQFAAFVATVDLALAEKVDLFLIAGDLFDSNVQPRRSVERVAAQLQRLAAGKIRTVIVPGTHDCYDRASIYRAHDVKALAGSTRDDDWVTEIFRRSERDFRALPEWARPVYTRPLPTTTVEDPEPIIDLTVAGATTERSSP